MEEALSFKIYPSSQILFTKVGLVNNYLLSLHFESIPQLFQMQNVF